MAAKQKLKKGLPQKLLPSNYNCISIRLKKKKNDSSSTN